MGSNGRRLAVVKVSMADLCHQGLGLDPTRELGPVPLTSLVIPSVCSGPHATGRDIGRVVTFWQTLRMMPWLRILGRQRWLLCNFPFPFHRKSQYFPPTRQHSLEAGTEST